MGLVYGLDPAQGHLSGSMHRKPYLPAQSFMLDLSMAQSCTPGLGPTH